ncbi:MAG: hypothetical protein K8R53_15880 [Bacteroidales bacterium]|nr:hypothetical protein [Bacteroidales bacterium]
MKTKILLLAFLVCSIATNSQDWIEFTAGESTKPDYELLSSTDTIVEFEITVPGMFSTAIDSFNRVQIKEHLRMDSTGYPEIPAISYLIAIPDCDSVIVNIEILDSINFNNFSVYPAPELVTDTTAKGGIALIEEFACDSAFYGSDIWFPGKVIEAVDKGAVRAQDVVRVLFFPISFNPVKKEIWAYSKANITLTFINPSGPLQRDVGIFNEMLGNNLINYVSNGLNASVSCGAGDGTYHGDFWVTSLPNEKIDDPCDYLIITPEGLYGNTDLNSLAMHRELFNGFDVKIISVDVIYSEMPSGQYYEQIWNLIKNTYDDGIANNTFDGKLAYVNLFGDIELENSQDDGIPAYAQGHDIYYTQLTIPDGEPDL